MHYESGNRTRKGLDHLSSLRGKKEDFCGDSTFPGRKLGKLSFVGEGGKYLRSNGDLDSELNQDDKVLLKQVLSLSLI